jgi:hypothetical protein
VNPSLLNFYSALFFNISLGVFALILILIFHGSAINRVLMRFERLTNDYLIQKKYNQIFFHFYLSFILIAVVHIFEILLWGMFLFRLDLIENPIDALLFAGSCYTTVGFVADILPVGWKSLAFFIAFTGLFSLAWTTSIMIGMTTIYKEAWQLKHAGRE